MALDQDFEAAAELIKNKVNKTLSDDELKEIYALYKQATCGDINIDKPGMMDIKQVDIKNKLDLNIKLFNHCRGCAKWEAWNSKKGVSSEEAKQQYIEMVEKMKEKHGIA